MQVSTYKHYFRYAGLEVSNFSDGHFKITQDMVSELRQLNYVDQWKLARAHRWHHILLGDLSFFAFSELAGKPSFGYYPCPLDIGSIADFLTERELKPTQRNRVESAEEYELAIETAALKDSITPIRYDIDFNAYGKGIHPAVHLHIGWNNDIRIATRRTLTPLAFVLFVIRQAYPKNWLNLLDHKDNLKLSQRIRSDLKEIEPEYWRMEDDLQHYLL